MNKQEMHMSKLASILLIDDSDPDNFYHRLVIGRAGVKCQVESITSSHDALKHLYKGLTADDEDSNQLPQLIFLDINMPAMNGFEFLAKLRELPDPYVRKKDLKIFMLTGSMNPDDRAMAIEQYGDLVTGFRIKPLTQDMIREIVKEYFPD